MVILSPVETLVGAAFNLPGKLCWGGGTGGVEVDLVVRGGKEGAQDSLDWGEANPCNDPIYL